MDLAALLAGRRRLADASAVSSRGAASAPQDAPAAASARASSLLGASAPRASNAGGLCGLANQGATCYLNSLLQALYMTPEFKAVIFNYRHSY